MNEVDDASPQTMSQCSDGEDAGFDSAAEKSDVDLSSSDHVRVVIRCRPLKPPKERDGSSELTLYPDGNSIRVVTKGVIRNYKFVCVADPSRDQDYIFRKTGKHVVECALSGFNGAIVAYGQTGSGKTYTMQGPGLENSGHISKKSQGVIQKVCEMIFAHKEQEDAADVKFSISAEYLEIYNENVVDLLCEVTSKAKYMNSRAARSPTQKVGIYEDAKGAIIVQNQRTVTVNSPEDCYKLLREGGTRRTVGATNMNSESSRSHAIFTLKIEKSDEGKGVKRVSKLHLVDLAGSERQRGTGATGIRLKEAGGINKSLSALGNVINALAEREGARKRGERPGRIPSYRDSKLTFLLKDSFGGNSKLCVIATISPALGYVDETANTLDFAKRCCSVRNEAVVNEHLSEDVARLQAEVLRLQQSTKQLRASLAKAKNTEIELRASATQIKTVPVHVRSSTSAIQTRKKDVRHMGVQTEEKISPFDDGKDILQSVKTKDLRQALDSLVEGRLESEDKESRTEKLCVLLTNAISREKYHQRKEKEMRQKISDSHQRWMEMLKTNEDLSALLRKREESLQNIIEADLEQESNAKGKRLQQEMEVLRVQAASNPDIILLRHKVAALESELELSGSSGKLLGEARLMYEEKVLEAQQKWLDMLNVNEDLLTAFRKAEKELHDIQKDGLEKTYGKEGWKLREKLEAIEKSKKEDPEKGILRSKAEALKRELVEFAEISLAAQKEALELGKAEGGKRPKRGVAAEFSTEVEELDDDMGNSTDEASDKENMAVEKPTFRKRGVLDKKQQSPVRKERKKERLITAEDALVEAVQSLDTEQLNNLSPGLFTYRALRRCRSGDVFEALRPFEHSVRNLEDLSSCLDSHRLEQ